MSDLTGVTYPKHPGITDQEHYQLLLHMNGAVDLTQTDEGRAIIAKYKRAADKAMGGKPVHIPEPGEMPPDYLEGDELNRWRERQRRQAYLDGDVQIPTLRGRRRRGDD